MDSIGVISRWELTDELDELEPMICYTVGFLLDDQEDFITVALSVGLNQVLGRLTIPKASILNMVILSESDSEGDEE